MIFIFIPIICAIIILCTFIITIKLPKLKGDKGEQKVAKILGKTITGQQYVINDLLFTEDLKNSCQIDHIFINKFGIWVIETKNYAGTIYGNPISREWKQVLAAGNVINTFYNPIKQNDTHIYRLSKYLNVKYIFHNIVVFLNHADISNLKIENIYSTSNLHKIKNIQTENTLSVEQMEYFYNKLLYLKANNTLSKKEHIQNIRNMQDNIHKGICPRCGGKLILREGKYGQFYGCSNFPKCKFTKNND